MTFHFKSGLKTDNKFGFLGLAVWISGSRALVTMAMKHF